MISLLQRFYDPDSGHITLDGVELKNLQLKWLRQQMGLVGQEPVLFNDTIRANIAYGKGSGDTATESEIIAAAELANAHKFISSIQQVSKNENNLFSFLFFFGKSSVFLSLLMTQAIYLFRATTLWWEREGFSYQEDRNSVWL